MTTPPEPPPSGAEREDQAAAAGAEVAEAIAIATAAIIAVMAATIVAVASGAMGVAAARRKVRGAVSGALGGASRKLRGIFARVAKQATAGGQAAGRQQGKTAGKAGSASTEPPAARSGRGDSGKAKIPGLPPVPDAPKAIAEAILTAQQDAGKAFEAAMYAALGGKGGPLRPAPGPYRDVVEKAMRRLTGIGEDVKNLTGAERAKQSLSRLQAAQVVMNELAGRGLTGFTGADGRRWELGAYAEMATRTASSRMHLASQLSMMAQAGNRLVIVDNPSMEAACPLCVLPGTVVEGPAPEWRIATEYAGEVVSITTASGKDLTGTPDHTVLTPQGWRRLKDLRPGDQVISNAGQQFAFPAIAAGAGVVVPDDVQVPALIEDAGKARVPLLLAGPARRDLNSDVAYREVQVVWSDSLLGNERNAALAEPLGDLNLILRVGAGKQFLRGGGILPAAEGDGSATGSLMGGVEHGRLLAGRGVCPAEPHGGGLLLMQDGRVHGFDGPPDARPLRPGLDARPPQVRSRDVAADAERKPQFLQRLPGDVAAAQLGRLVFGEFAQSDPRTIRGHAVGGEDGEGLRLADMEGGLELLKRLAGSVAADEILTVNVGHYSGHVWDLQTAPSWYLTNGIVTHNCRPYEGKVLALYGSGSGSATITDAGGTKRTEKIKGTLEAAVAAGLLHPNCRHSLSPWADGAGAVATAGGKERGYVEGGKAISRSLPIGTPQDYVNEQRLRGHERAVRYSHARLLAAVTPQAKARAKLHLAASQGALKEHVRKTGATRLPHREKAGKAR